MGEGEFLKDDKKSTKQPIFLYASIAHFLLIIALTTALVQSEKLRGSVIDTLIGSGTKHGSDAFNSFDYCVKTFFLGVLAQLIGFPVFIIEVINGFVLQDVVLASLLNFSFKMTAVSIAFFISRRLFKKNMQEIMDSNETFREIKNLVERNPFKMLVVYRLITLPPLIHDYGPGLYNVLYIQFALAFGSVISFFAVFYTLVGLQIADIKDSYVQHGELGVGSGVTIISLLFTVAVIFFGHKYTAKQLKIARAENINPVSEQQKVK